VHALAIVALVLLTDGRNLVERSEPIAVLGGALAYLFLFWGALFPRSRVTSLGFAVLLLVAAMLTRLWAFRSSASLRTIEPVRAS
jgi:hypothetical protein